MKGAVLCVASLRISESEISSSAEACRCPMPTESTFLLAGLFLLLAAAGLGNGTIWRARRGGRAALPLNIDYLKGLNFLAQRADGPGAGTFPRDGPG